MPATIESPSGNPPQHKNSVAPYWFWEKACQTGLKVTAPGLSAIDANAPAQPERLWRFGIRPSMPRPPIYKRWTETEDEVLKRLWAELPTLNAIARRMRRSEGTVRQKGAALGLPPKEPAGGRQKRDAIP